MLCLFLHLKGTNVHRIVQPLWHNNLTASLKTSPFLVSRQPSLGSYIRFLLSRPDQSPGTSGVGGRSPGSPLSKITKQWTNPVFPCEYTNHEDAEFAMVMLDYWRVHRMTEIIFDRTGFNKHLALSPKGLLFGSWPWTCIVTYVWTANDKLKRHNLERPTTLRELCWLIIAWSVFPSTSHTRMLCDNQSS